MGKTILEESTQNTAYIPEPLPDELLYSFLGRLAAYNSFANPREYLKSMFGTKNIIPSPDLPTSLNELQNRLGSQSPFESAKKMIDSVTLYPYHRPFLSLERHERVEAILLGGEGDRLKTLLGRVANGFGANPSLRYCLECRQNDVRDHGAPYWHRIHQLPGIIACAKHGIELITFLWPSESSHRQRIELVPVAPQAKCPSRKSADAQVAFARSSADLLRMNLPALGPDRWSKPIRQRLQKMVLATRMVGFAMLCSQRLSAATTMALQDFCISGASSRLQNILSRGSTQYSRGRTDRATPYSICC